MGEKVFINTTKNVFGAAFFISEADIADKVDELAEALFVESWAGVIFGKDILERWVVAFDRLHGIIHEAANGGLNSTILEKRPAGLERHPEDIESAVLVWVLRVGAGSALGLEAGMMLFEGI